MMMNQMNNRKIRVKHKKLGKEKAWGMAHNGIIYLDPRLSGTKHLEILVHEALHILYPGRTEEEIINESIRLTKTLWAQGYRKIDENNTESFQDDSKI